MSVVALFNDTPTTLTMLALTVTVQEAFLPASEVVTVIVANPALTPVTKPLFDTVATAALLLLHVTFRFVALAGVMEWKRVSVPLMSMAVLALFNDTPVTETVVGMVGVVGVVDEDEGRDVVLLEQAAKISRPVSTIDGNKNNFFM
jgi:hypothetical protein